ncbi:hypothetical protein B296_00029567 [Ensete ventricosum]|uniref:Uncharacterized protein n=1 Tax=Ensete ventricosum TaxID=4639 RepID=A0A427AL10_ENSVE|nr:hypothetical protein B296_00029567 [Ensete ventricosum]
MQCLPRGGQLRLSCHPDVQPAKACFRRTPRDGLDAADARDVDLAGRGGFGKIYPRHRSLGWHPTYVQRLKEGGDPEVVATDEGRASEA